MIQGRGGIEELIHMSSTPDSFTLSTNPILPSAHEVIHFSIHPFFFFLKSIFTYTPFLFRHRALDYKTIKKATEARTHARIIQTERQVAAVGPPCACCTSSAQFGGGQTSAIHHFLAHGSLEVYAGARDTSQAAQQADSQALE